MIYYFKDSLSLPFYLYVTPNTTLFRQFKEEMQITIFHFIKQHRLLKAFQLLENRDMHIAEIVYQIGYGRDYNE